MMTDIQTITALSGILAATCLLIAWQSQLSTERGAAWLNHAALSLELLGLALSVFWAVTAPDGSVLPVIFVIGWIGMLIGRAVGIHQAVVAGSNKQYSRLALVVVSLTVAYTALYGSGLFHALNASGDEAEARLEASLPAQALDQQIANTRERLANTAIFADASKAHRETQAAARLAEQARQQAVSIQAQLSALQPPVMPAATARYMNADCSPKTNSSGVPYTTRAKNLCPKWEEMNADYLQKRALLESQLHALRGNTPANTSSYAARHAEYIGLQKHLEMLLQQRAELSASGKGAISAWRPEDRFIAWWFGISPEQASSLKWLILTAIFDVLALLFRVQASLVHQEGEEQAARRKFNGLLDAGVGLNETLAIMGGVASIPPAKVSVPSLDTGGYVLSDGLALIHAGERVLTVAETAEYAEYEAMHTNVDNERNTTHTNVDNERNTTHTNVDNERNTTQQAKCKKGEEGVCPTCSSTFTRKNHWHVYCRESCRIKGNGYADKKTMLAAKKRKQAGT